MRGAAEGVVVDFASVVRQDLSARGVLVGEEIGDGAFSVVYEARPAALPAALQQLPRHRYAVKVLDDNNNEERAAREEDFLRRFGCVAGRARARGGRARAATRARSGRCAGVCGTRRSCCTWTTRAWDGVFSRRAWG